MSAVALQFADRDLPYSCAVENRIARVGDQRAIEISADKLNFGGHSAPECKNGFRLRNGAIPDYAQEHEHEGDPI